MTEPTNADRAERARLTLEYYRALIGATTTGDDDQTIVGDLLADLMHLSAESEDEAAFDVDRALSMARDHFEAEQDEAAEV